MGEREAFISLNGIEGLGPVKVRSLLSTFESAGEVFSRSPEELSAVRGIGQVLARRIAESDPLAFADAEMKLAREMGAEIITFLDDAYPPALSTIHDPPLVLYVRGTLPGRDGLCLGVVGSRRCSHYGKMMAHRFGYQLGRAGICVVSGLARGVDQAAHRGAIDAGGTTVAVLGSGLARISPVESETFAGEIEKHGAVISEYPLEREADRTTFPYRNRIISGLSMGVFLVEAGLQSGAMHTADAALEQGRTVFAMPGRIDSPSSQGCHALIRQGAVLVTDLADILEEVGGLVSVPAGSRDVVQGELFRFSDEERKVLEMLSAGEVDVDFLARETGLGAARLGVVLLALEMKKAVKSLPGRRVEKTGSRVSE